MNVLNPTAIAATRRGLLGAALAAVIAPGVAGAQSTPEATPVALPDSPVGQQLAWLVEMLNGGAAELTVETIEERFSPTFLAVVSAEELIATTQAIATELAPVRLAGFDGEPGETDAVALLESEPLGQTFALSISVEPEPPYPITGLFIEPAASDAATPVAVASWEDLDAQLSALAPVAQATVAEVVDGEIELIHGFNSAEPFAIGSIYKLYVLGELARQVEAGEASWDEQLAIRDDWKSYPMGEMMNLPAGEKFSLRYYAEQMISVSDNTAADHLLFRLGRGQVEAIQGSMGNTNAARNVPMLTTRELFTIKLAFDPAWIEAYIAAPVEERRTLLESEVAAARATDEAAAAWTTPTAIDTIEWFASGEDIARAHAALQSLADPAVREILAINPGLEFPPETWRYAGYKGGSELGVLALSWLVERGDGRWFAFNVGINNPDEAFGPSVEPTVAALAQQAVILLGSTP